MRTQGAERLWDLTMVTSAEEVMLLNCGAGEDFFFLFFLFFFNFYFYFILLSNTVLVLPYINMNPPRVYMQSQA